MKLFLHEDCMDVMKRYPDNYFDLAIVDPPYFSGPEKREYYGRKVSPIGVNRLYGKTSEWKIPNRDYFDELFRVSKNQIIWGVNYFDYSFGPGRIVWDKVNGKSSFSDCEIAYCSLHDSIRLFRYMWNGMMQGKSISEGHIQQGNKALNEVRIHPTQKPISLYLWLLQTYAKEGDKILDTHVGSASSLIACQELGFEYVGCELDRDIFNLAKQRLNDYEKQIKLFQKGIGGFGMIPKFRAWLKKEQKMDNYIDHISWLEDELYCIGDGITYMVSAEDLVLMQSTGLRDKNGKEIFEGDVVRQVRTQPTTENETITGVVTMIEGAWLIMNDCEQLASYLWSETDENEIIGNVYENRELLEDE